ncbi:hypothetical protein R6Q59_009811 [Mikania micrantha]
MTVRRCGFEIDYTDILKSLISTAKQAGISIVNANPSSNADVGTKKNSADLVTETDQAVEKQIRKYLLTRFPTFKFWGEETYKPGTLLGDEPTFIVDPIDGTTNFVHGHSYVSVSLGFSVCKEPRVGVVFNPFTGVLYYGSEGEGSYKMKFYLKDGEWVEQETVQALPLRRPTPLTNLSETLVALEYGSDRSGSNWTNKMKTWDSLGKGKEEGGAMVHSARFLGSAALNFCGVAEGTLDIYWEGGCWAWDVCAGWVILKEAGGMVVDGNPGTWDIPVTHRKYLAVRAAPSGQKEIVEEFWSHIAGPMEYEH